MAPLRIYKLTEKDEIGYFAPRTWDFRRSRIGSGFRPRLDFGASGSRCPTAGSWTTFSALWPTTTPGTQPTRGNHPDRVYGFGAVFMTLLIEPLKEARRPVHRATLRGASPESLVIAIVIAMVLELGDGTARSTSPTPRPASIPFLETTRQLPLNIFWPSMARERLLHRTGRP